MTVDDIQKELDLLKPEREAYAAKVKTVMTAISNAQASFNDLDIINIHKIVIDFKNDFFDMITVPCLDVCAVLQKRRANAVIPSVNVSIPVSSVPRPPSVGSQNRAKPSGGGLDLNNLSPAEKALLIAALKGKS